MLILKDGLEMYRLLKGKNVNVGAAVLIRKFND